MLSKGVRMRWKIAVILVLAACSSICDASFSKNDAGTSAGQVLKMGAGARASGMGEAFTAVADDASAVYWNPAGMAMITNRSLSFMHAAWFESIVYDWFSYVHPLTKKDFAGVGIQYLSYGSISGTDSSGNTTGDFTPSDMVGTLSYARHFSSIGVSLGVNAKYLSSKIKNNASAFAVDLGAVYPLMPAINVGAVVQNIGTKMKYYQEEDALPLTVKLGSEMYLLPGWLISFDINAPIDNAVTPAIGTEYRYQINAKSLLIGRTGYNSKAKDTGGLNGISGGLGFVYRQICVDYAFVPYGDLGDTHRISFSFLIK
jgi:hypothetical protein